MSRLNFYFYSLLLLVFLVAPNAARAARLYFEVSERAFNSINGNREWEIVLKLDAEETVNAVEAAWQLPANATTPSFTEGHSLISFWLEKPEFDSTQNKFSFSGVIPGGWRGQAGELLRFRLHLPGELDTASVGPATLNWLAEDTQVLLNDGVGGADQIELVSLDLDSSANAPNQNEHSYLSKIVDQEPPEAFTPFVTTSPELFSGAYFVVFATSDKGSGIDFYEIAEERSLFKRSVEKLAWQKVESPALLADQELKSFIYLRAVDRAGLARYAIIPPSAGLASFPLIMLWVIIILVILFLFWLCARFFFG